jgi:LDH2 family malate/lactate/ureidoglycolate dehydrogenase
VVATQPRVPADALEQLTAAVLQASGVPANDAALVADTLVSADLWGHASHGTMRLASYVDRLRSGVMRPVTQIETVVDAGAVAVLDGNDGVGQVVAAASAREAIRRARAHGVAAVSARNSNHVGCLAYFTRMAAGDGCAALFASNASPAMAPWGGREPRVGTNPWSIAAPAGRTGTMVMDIANTAVARGKIHLARQRGTSIPEGWALDADGAPTTDPERALAGLILPMAGHKGYAIALMMDVLAGVLSGSAIGSEVAGPFQAERRGGNGHLFIALDVAAFLEPEAFAARMEQLVADVKAEGLEAVQIPGELEDRNAARGRAEGIALPERTVADLRRLAAETGVDFALWPGEDR